MTVDLTAVAVNDRGLDRRGGQMTVDLTPVAVK